MIEYPDPDKIVEFNLLALSMIKAKKSDAPQVLSRAKIAKAVEGCEAFEGTIFDKAVVLLKGLVQAHAFASGNRRTAFLVTKYFLMMNGQKSGIGNKAENAKVLLGIRENFYLHEEIKGWIKNGQIKEFRR